MNANIRSFLIVLAAAGTVGATAVWTAGWSAVGASRNYIVDNPGDSLGIVRSLSVELDDSGKPVRGTVVFLNGVQRSMKAGEIAYEWALYGGRQLWWENLRRTGLVETLGNKRSPEVGRPAHIVTRSGVEYFGIVAAFTRYPNIFVLDIEDTLVQFDKSVLDVFEQASDRVSMKTDARDE